MTCAINENEIDAMKIVQYGQVIKSVNIVITMLTLEMLIVVILMTKESVHIIIVHILKVKDHKIFMKGKDNHEENKMSGLCTMDR